MTPTPRPSPAELLRQASSINGVPVTPQVTSVESLARQLGEAGIPFWTREYRFAKPRRWAFDFALPEQLLAVEVEGGTWSTTRKSRHTTGTGYRDDCIKYSEAAIRGWCVVRVTSDMVADGSALALVLRAVEATGT